MHSKIGRKVYDYDTRELASADDKYKVTDIITIIDTEKNLVPRILDFSRYL